MIKMPVVIPVTKLDQSHRTSAFPDVRLLRPVPWGLPEWSAIAQVAGPGLLYLPGTQVFRVPLRF